MNFSKEDRLNPGKGPRLGSGKWKKEPVVGTKKSRQETEVEKGLKQGGRLKQAAEELARAQLSPVNCCSHGSYITSPTPVPIWGIAVIVGTSVQE